MCILLMCVYIEWVTKFTAAGYCLGAVPKKLIDIYMYNSVITRTTSAYDFLFILLTRGRVYYVIFYCRLTVAESATAEAVRLKRIQKRQFDEVPALFFARPRMKFHLSSIRKILHNVRNLWDSKSRRIYKISGIYEFLAEAIQTVY